ncbi:MAG TPA: hypothetical protein VF681_10635 [Abditibacteriaceae bacterium]|jgi:hypothetical protein
MKFRPFSQSAKGRLQIVFAALLISLCGPIGIELMRALQVAPYPQFLTPVAQWLLSLFFVLPIMWVVAALASPFLSIYYVFKPQQRHMLSACSAIWLTSWAGLPLSRSIRPLRDAGLASSTQRAKPLIAALEHYRKAHGDYPEQLHDLVPAYTSSVPSTGMLGYPKFHYRKTAAGSPFRTYELKVRTPGGGINFDSLVYWPEKSYPPRMYGGSIERINDWAYVHE